MKKGKKLFGAIGVLALLVTAFVAFGSGKAVKADDVKNPDEQTVTLHKYAFSTDQTQDIENDGSDKSAELEKRSGEPLDNINFDFYNVTEKYYELLASDEAKASDNAAQYASAELQKLTDYTSFTKTTSGTTANGGVLEESLAVKTAVDGKDENSVYLIVEADQSGKVKSTQNLVISLPFYDKDGTTRLSNVNLYPKNVLNEASLKFTKYGVKDDKTDALAGAKFKVKNSAGLYITAISDKTGQVTYGKKEDAKVFTSDDKGLVEVPQAALADDTYTFEEQVDANGITVTEKDKDADGNTIDYTAEKTDAVAAIVKSGAVMYIYFDKDGKTPKSTTDSDSVAMYNYEIPVPDKKVDGKENEAVEVGQKVEYTITQFIPLNISTYDEFTISDTPAAGLKLNPDSLNASSAVITKTDKTETKLTTNPTIKDNNFEYAFLAGADKEAIQSAAGQTVTITYTATITDKAAIQQNVDNTVTFNPGNTPKTKIHKTPIITYGKQFEKIDASTSDKLAGAQFIVLRKGENGNYQYRTTQAAETSQATETTGSSVADTSTESTEPTEPAETTDSSAATATPEAVYGWADYTADNLKNSIIPKDALVLTSAEKTGAFDVKGLALGSYELKEVKTPSADYQLPTSTVSFEVTETSYYENATKLELAKPDDVANKQKGVLPHTGGKGIIAFIVAGIAIIVIAVVYFKRRHTELEA